MTWHQQKQGQKFFSEGCKGKLELSAIFPVNYLGLLPSIQYPTAKHFSPLMDKLRSKTDGWMTHSLSFDGRLKPIKTVPSDILTYWFHA